MKESNDRRNKHSLDVYAIIIAFVALCVSLVTTYRQFFYEERSLMLYVVPAVSDDGVKITANFVNSGFGANVFLERIDVFKHFALGSDNENSESIMPSTFLVSGRENSYSVNIPLKLETGDRVDVGYQYIENICRFYEIIRKQGSRERLAEFFAEFQRSASGIKALITIKLVITFRVEEDLYVKDVEVIRSNLTKVYKDSIDATMWAVGAIDLFDHDNPDGYIFAEARPDSESIFAESMTNVEKAKAESQMLMPRHMISYTIDDDGQMEFSDISPLFPSVYKQSWSRKYWNPDFKERFTHVGEHCNNSENKE